MLTQSIVKYFPPTPKPSKGKKGKKPRIVAGSVEHKFNIFHGTINKAQRAFSEGDWVTFHGEKGEGIIVTFEEDFSRVQWDGMKALVVEVYIPGDELDTYMYHPSDLVLIGKGN